MLRRLLTDCSGGRSPRSISPIIRGKLPLQPAPYVLAGRRQHTWTWDLAPSSRMISSAHNFAFPYAEDGAHPEFSSRIKSHGPPYTERLLINTSRFVPALLAASETFRVP